MKKRNEIRAYIESIWNDHRLFHNEKVNQTVDYVEQLLSKCNADWGTLLKNVIRKREERGNKS